MPAANQNPTAPLLCQLHREMSGAYGPLTTGSLARRGTLGRGFTAPLTCHERDLGVEPTGGSHGIRRRIRGAGPEVQPLEVSGVGAAGDEGLEGARRARLQRVGG